MRGTTAPIRAQGFNEGLNKPYTSEDLRFVQKGGKLYAFVMAWPDSGRVTIKSLATGSAHAPGTVERVELLGSVTPLQHARTGDGLTITMPERRVGEYVYTLEISGSGLVRS